MARLTPPPVAVFLSLLFLFTLSRAIQTPFPEPKPESEPVTEPNKPKPHSHDTVSFTIDTIDPVPLTFLRFRPINRHFQPRRPLPSYLITGHRRCRGGHRREIPYGNDAILSSDAARRIHHQRWDRAHGAVALPRLPVTIVEHRDFDHHGFDHHDFDHEHHHHHHRHRDHHHREENWFAKKIRKFFDLF